MYIAYICAFDIWSYRILYHEYLGLLYRTESIWMVPGTSNANRIPRPLDKWAILAGAVERDGNAITDRRLPHPDQ